MTVPHPAAICPALPTSSAPNSPHLQAAGDHAPCCSICRSSSPGPQAQWPWKKRSAPCGKKTEMNECSCVGQATHAVQQVEQQERWGVWACNGSPQQRWNMAEHGSHTSVRRSYRLAPVRGRLPPPPRCPAGCARQRCLQEGERWECMHSWVGWMASVAASKRSQPLQIICARTLHFKHSIAACEPAALMYAAALMYDNQQLPPASPPHHRGFLRRP